jgi:transposase
MYFIGIDISKAKLDCSLLLERQSTKRRAKSVANSASGVDALLDWCVQKQNILPHELHVVLEATGVYHETAATLLVDAGVTVSIVNPAQVKDFARSLGIRTKTDGIDSLVLARYGDLLNPRPWTPPTPEIRELKALVARREAILQDLQREHNRQEKAQATNTPPRVLKSITESIEFLEKQLTQLERDLDDHKHRHPRLKTDYDLLISIPAVGPQVSYQMLSIIHSHHFQSAEQLAAYLGLVPIERQSGTSLHGRPRLSKAGPARVRAVLYMAAIVGTRYNPHIQALYQRLQKRGKSKKSALGAAMRKLVHLCFGVLKTQQPYLHNYATQG